MGRRRKSFKQINLKSFVTLQIGRSSSSSNLLYL